MRNYPPKNKIAIMIEEYWRKRKLDEALERLQKYYDYEKYLNKTLLEISNKKKEEKEKKLFRNNLTFERYRPSFRMERLLKSIDEEEEKKTKEVKSNRSLIDMILDKNLSDYSRENYSKRYDYGSKFNYDPDELRTPSLYNYYSSIKSGEEQEEEEEIEKEKITIDKKINNLRDLIDLCDEYPEQINVEYNINMNSIRKIKPHLEQLDNLIGMKTLKENMVDQILYYVQDFHKMLGPDSVQNDYMHTVIYGPPGTGKTEVAKIMGQIFSNLGVLKNNVFKKVTREDLVAGYLGQTATKTKEVLQSCKGGVLFIDEAYALGNAEKKDSFSKESIDTICEALSDMRGEFMCIIAGYEKELKSCFFSYNEGLESRFTWRFKIDEYNSKEMNQIFAKKVNDLGWKLDDIELDNWFEKEMSNFRYFGRDMETLLSKSKIAHSRRVFCLEPEKKGLLTMEDLEKGMSMFMNNDLQKEKEDKRFQKYLQNTLYL
jgi:SpoVK/Ycf46/Vps4 family AAA+-type ATPase